MVNFIDAHCHLADETIAANLNKELQEAREAGVTHFISSALSQQEIKWHHQNQFPGMFWCAGIHPYYKESAESDFELLIKLCDEKQIVGIGEIGLDNRKDNINWQKKMLLKQLDLAANYDLPVVFHVVKQYYELHKILKNNFPKIRGFLHAFKGSLAIFDTFKQYELAFSLCGKLPRNEVINSLLKHGFYLFETDAPYQKPQEEDGEFNHLKNLIKPVEKVSKLTGLEPQKLKSSQFNCFKQLFGNIG